jgi:hypothetical protein
VVRDRIDRLARILEQLFVDVRPASCTITAIAFAANNATTRSLQTFANDRGEPKMGTGTNFGARSRKFVPVPIYSSVLFSPQNLNPAHR